MMNNYTLNTNKKKEVTGRLIPAARFVITKTQMK
jgi:hypothetical protein